MMTIDQFVDEFKNLVDQNNTKFSFSMGKLISCQLDSGEWRCPIIYVNYCKNKRKFLSSSVLVAAHQLGLSYDNAMQIVLAADEAIGYNPTIRRKLLEILNNAGESSV